MGSRKIKWDLAAILWKSAALVRKEILLRHFRGTLNLLEIVLIMLEELGEKAKHTFSLIVFIKVAAQQAARETVQGLSVTSILT